MMAVLLLKFWWHVMMTNMRYLYNVRVADINVDFVIFYVVFNQLLLLKPAAQIRGKK